MPYATLPQYFLAPFERTQTHLSIFIRNPVAALMGSKMREPNLTIKVVKDNGLITIQSRTMPCHAFCSFFHSDESFYFYSVLCHAWCHVWMWRSANPFRLLRCACQRIRTCGSKFSADFGIHGLKLSAIVRRSGIVISASAKYGSSNIGGRA